MYILRFVSDNPKYGFDQRYLNLTQARKFAKDAIENNGVERVDIFVQREDLVEILTPKPVLKSEKVVEVQKTKEKE